MNISNKLYSISSSLNSLASDIISNTWPRYTASKYTKQELLAALHAEHTKLSLLITHIQDKGLPAIPYLPDPRCETCQE